MYLFYLLRITTYSTYFLEKTNQLNISCGIIWCNQQGENKTKQEIIII